MIIGPSKANRRFLPGAAVLFGATMLATTAQALPALQLNIPGGSYETVDETVISTAEQFQLDAYATVPGGQDSPDHQNGNLTSTQIETNNFYLAMSVRYHGNGTPEAVTTPAALGSFTINSLGGGFTFDMLPNAGDGGGANPGTTGVTAATVDVTADMELGQPSTEHGKNLPTHGVYESFYAMAQFQFEGPPTLAGMNTQDDAGKTPAPGSDMYARSFDIDTSGLNSQYEIHFDLFTEIDKGPSARGASRYKLVKAPFSHDAASWPPGDTPPGPSTEVPEPAAFTLFGLGVLGLGVARRRRRKQAA